MKRLRDLIDRYPLTTFIVLTWGFSWSLWFLLIASARGWVSFQAPTSWLGPVGTFGPSLAAIAVVGLSRGKAGVKELVKPILQWHFGGRWYCLVIFGGMLVWLVPPIYTLLSGEITMTLSNLVPQALVFLILFGLILVIGGPLGEEIGWRGYLLPRLLERRSPLRASLILSVFWFVWHLPQFWSWFPGAAPAAAIPLFLITVVAYSVLFTWVYLGTSGSLMAILLLHTSINTAEVALLQAYPGIGERLLYYGIVAMIWVAVSAVVVIFKWPGFATRTGSFSPQSSSSSQKRMSTT
jgi:uncharacterized protein